MAHISSSDHMISPIHLSNQPPNLIIGRMAAALHQVLLYFFFYRDVFSPAWCRKSAAAQFLSKAEVYTSGPTGTFPEDTTHVLLPPCMGPFMAWDVGSLSDQITLSVYASMS